MEKCEYCKYFKEFEDDAERGACFRYPPTLDGHPVTESTWFCGEFIRRKYVRDSVCA